jgi:hypothetical protein
VELPRIFLPDVDVRETTRIVRLEGRIEIFPIDPLARPNAAPDRRSMKI